MAAYKDPDDILVVLFKHIPRENEARSLAEGRPIFEDVEACEIRAPGARDVKVFHAHEFARWINDPYTGNQRKQTYAERFQHQYRQFKEHAAQTKIGTPLEHAPFLTEARRSELRAQNIYTVEALADIEGAELKNLGPGGREMKNQAMSYIDDSKLSAPTKIMQAELEMLRSRNAILEGDAQIKKKIENEFEQMTLEQLRDFITTNTGQAPQGNCNHKTLVRMAVEARPQKVA